MKNRADRFIPALRFPALTRYYDRVLASTLKEGRFRNLLLDQARIEPGHQVLDIGCGTGTLALLVKQRVPETHVVALDADGDALDIAREKARDAGADRTCATGFSRRSRKQGSRP